MPRKVKTQIARIFTVSMICYIRFTLPPGSCLNEVGIACKACHTSGQSPYPPYPSCRPGDPLLAPPMAKPHIPEPTKSSTLEHYLSTIVKFAFRPRVGAPRCWTGLPALAMPMPLPRFDFEDPWSRAFRLDPSQDVGPMYTAKTSVLHSTIGVAWKWKCVALSPQPPLEAHFDLPSSTNSVRESEEPKPIQ